MNPKKMKLILAVSVLLNALLVVIMLVCKDGYNTQAQDSYKTATTAYTKSVKNVLNAQNAFIQGSNAIWQIAFETSAKNLSQKDFNARVAALDSAKILNPQENGDVISLSCGEGCSVPFTFKNGKFVSVDTKALSSVSASEKFQVAAPAPFEFNAK